MNRREFFKISVAVAAIPLVTKSIDTNFKINLVQKKQSVPRFADKINSWDKTQEYFCGDIIFSNNSMYVATNDTQNYLPPGESIFWEKV